MLLESAPGEDGLDEDGDGGVGEGGAMGGSLAGKASGVMAQSDE